MLKLLLELVSSHDLQTAAMWSCCIRSLHVVDDAVFSYWRCVKKTLARDLYWSYSCSGQVHQKITFRIFEGDSFFCQLGYLIRKSPSPIWPRNVFSGTLNHNQSIFLQAGCPSCHPTNTVRTLKGKVWKWSKMCIAGGLQSSVTGRSRWHGTPTSAAWCCQCLLQLHGVSSLLQHKWYGCGQRRIQGLGLSGYSPCTLSALMLMKIS